jgi:hypothetical protein
MVDKLVASGNFVLDLIHAQSNHCCSGCARDGRGA